MTIGTVIVDRLRFAFDPGWLVVIKWDEHDAYREGIERLKGKLDGNVEASKAVDLVGVREEILYLVEVKDFRPVRGAGEPQPK